MRSSARVSNPCAATKLCMQRRQPFGTLCPDVPTVGYERDHRRNDSTTCRRYLSASSRLIVRDTAQVSPAGGARASPEDPTVRPPLTAAAFSSVSVITRRVEGWRRSLSWDDPIRWASRVRNSIQPVRECDPGTATSPARRLPDLVTNRIVSFDLVVPVLRRDLLDKGVQCRLFGRRGRSALSKISPAPLARPP
jgi:hypothetical protein